MQLINSACRVLITLLMLAGLLFLTLFINSDTSSAKRPTCVHNLTIGSFENIWFPGGNNKILVGTDVVFGSSWSANSLRLAYASQRNEDAPSRIHSVLATGRNNTPLTRGNVQTFSPSWSPNGNKIAYVDNDRNRIEIIDPDSDFFQATPSFRPYKPIPIAWSPNGREIASVAEDFNNADRHLRTIYFIDANRGSVSSAITVPRDIGHVLKIGYSRDDDSLIFEGYNDLGINIYSLNLRNSRITQLTDDPLHGASSHEFSVSPNGRKIAFTSGRTGDDEIYVMNIDGSNQRNLTNNNAGDRSPTWSPDSRRIAFSSNRDGDYDVYWLNVGSPQRQINLTNSQRNNIDPTWSPNGRMVSFKIGGNLYTMTAPHNEFRVVYADVERICIGGFYRRDRLPEPMLVPEPDPKPLPGPNPRPVPGPDPSPSPGPDPKPMPRSFKEFIPLPYNK